MQEIKFGEEMPNSGSKFLKVKQKGDKLKFRLAQQPVYVGKHFIKVSDSWDVTSCDRINNQEGCGYCDLFFQAKAEEKKNKDTNPEESKKWGNEARIYSPAITFYFPVLNRDTESFGILQTTQGVRNKINAQHEAGIDVFKKDWILHNTGSENPGDRYALVPVDSADSKPFTEKEEEEFKKAQEFDLMSLNEGQSQQDEVL
jgi:hypothetical protein